jgi:beta-1,2-mannobiose phosphorylase / 1,2-beta-oligomannan phosphorylase
MLRQMSLRGCVRVGLILASLAVSAEAGEFPPELTRWQPRPGNPVFTAAGLGHWDVKIRERGWILRDGNRWQLWYTGYDGTREGVKSLGYATSTDGLHWTRSGDAPIYQDSWVEDMCVVRVGGVYHMFAEGFQDRAQRLTSPDGIHWTRVGTLDVRLANGDRISDGPFGTPTVWYEDGVWNLFYERHDAGIWLARSQDLKVWTNLQDEAVMSPGPDEFDRDLIAMNQVLKYKSRYYAVIHGAKKPAHSGQPSLWATGLAASDDLVRWEKFPGNPLRPIAENKSSGLLIPVGDGFRLYTMHNDVDAYDPVSASR